MTISKNQSVRAATVIAGMCVLAMSFGPFAAQAQISVTASTSAAFTRDLTVGSTGADVTALQTWLIGKGFSIPAGATGYFGSQTKAAVAAYQAANAITPAVGYFGPITRGRVDVAVKPSPTTPTKPVENDNDNDEEEDEDENDLEIDVEFRDGRAYIEIEEDGDRDEYSIKTTSRTKVIEDVAERLDEDEDDIEDIIEFSTKNGGTQGNTHSPTTTSSAKTVVVDGADNDYANFELSLDVKAFGADMFIPRDADDAFTYQIEDAGTGTVVSGATSLSASLSSDATNEGSSYVVREGDTEIFKVRVSFNPLSSDEGKTYRLQLLTLRYGHDAGEMDKSSTLRPEGKFETDSTFVAD